jgi:hypothetical protein
MSSPRSLGSFVVRQHDPRRARALALAVGLGWLLCVGLTWWIATLRAAPGYERLKSELDQTRERYGQSQKELESTRERESLATRSDQVSRTANQSLQDSLREREEEIAALRADLAFYQRLVGGRAPRQGLTVHQLALKAIGDSRAYAFRLTLTQNLKKAATSAGQVELTVDGVRGAKLAALGWSDLTQDAKAEPIKFQFKYFQQLDGSLMLPEGFQPNRVTVTAKSDSGDAVKQAFAWRDAVAAGASSDVWQ